MSADDSCQLLDANIRILRSEKHGKTLKLHFDYANEAEFTFASKPVKVTVDGKAVKVSGKQVKAAIGEKSVMTVKFA